MIASRFRSIPTTSAIALAALAGTAMPSARAADDATKDGQWSFRIGAGALLSPEYPGSDDLDAMALPVLSARYEPWFFAGPLEGIGFNLVNTGRTTAGLAVRYGGGRDNEGELAPIQEVDAGALGRAFLQYKLGPARAALNVEQAWTGDNRGERVHVSLGSGVPLGQSWRLRGGMTLSWHSDDWNDAIFSLSPSEAGQLGVNTFRAESGLSRAGVDTALTYRWTERWSVTQTLGYGRLLDDAADSPITAELGDANQWSASITALYRF